MKQLKTKQQEEKDLLRKLLFYINLNDTTNFYKII
jgi:hypothetical protein